MRGQEPKVAVQSYNISHYGISLLNEGNAIMQYQHLGKLEILMFQSLRFPTSRLYQWTTRFQACCEVLA